MDSHTLPQTFNEDDKSQDIFIKLIKYYQAKSLLNNAKEILSDLSILTHKMRSVKSHQTSLLDAWQSQLEETKARVSNTLNNIFEKV